MINWIVLSSLIGAVTIVTSEILRTKKIISNESSRKVLHIAHGVVVASWVFVTNYVFIIAAEVLFLIAVMIARKIDVLQPLRTVGRSSWGDYFFPLGIIAVALISPSKVIFFVSILHLAVADALAALVGRKFKKGEYHVFGHRKTIAGTLTFLFVSLAILYYFQSNLIIGYSYTAIMVTAFIVTLAENISPYGSDNTTIPLVVAVMLIFFAPGPGL